MDAFATQVTGWLFVAAATMSWVGITFLPAPIGTFFERDDFARVLARLRVWIWLYRVHLFGYLVTLMAFVALATLLSDAPARIVIWPAVAVCGAGLLTSALAGAFYYHFGAWGALDMKGRSPDAVDGFVASLRVTTEYVTCLVRFGRVFFGLGQLVLAIGLLYGGLVPAWVGASAAILGIGAMALTMGLPDDLHLYRYIFHLNILWLVALGLVVLRLG